MPCKYDRIIFLWAAEHQFFVDVSVAQLVKVSMISWATRIGAGPGSIPEFKLTYN